MDRTQRFCVLFALSILLLIENSFAVRVGPKNKKVSDQSTSASWWQHDAINAADLVDQGGDFFSSTHGLAQTHPGSLGSGSVRYQPATGGKKSSLGGPSQFKHQDFRTSATAELRRNPNLSAPDECARACREGEPPRICYYHFTLEFYTVLGAACQVCTPNATNTVWSHCQCVLADGVERGILTANRMIPGPSIQVCEGDKVVIDVENHLEGMEVTLHWHGIWQRGSQYYDGVPFVTQCPIQQGNSFRYQWIAGNAGTHFWHAHTGLQKMDGLYGSVIVRQAPNKDPNSHLYDFDLTTHVMLLSDWLHEDAAERFPGRLAVNTGQDPESMLINGKGQFRDPNTGFMTNTPLEVFTITPGRRYRFRVINSFASVCPAQLTIQGHDLTLIATDGEPVHPVVVNTIISFSGERYDFVINADQTVGAYWIQLRGLGECGIRRAQQLAILRYARGPYQPATQAPTYDVGIPQGIVLNPLDARCNEVRAEAICVNQLKNAKPIDQGILQQRPDVKIFLPFRFHIYTPQDLFAPNTYNRHLIAPNGDHVISLIDEISYMAPPTPLISQYDDINPDQFCNGDNRPANCGQNCMCTHKIDIPLNAVVEVVLVDEVQQTNLSHPFHLHGYAFHVIGIGRSPDRNVKKINLKHALDLDRQGLLHRQFNLPPSKDTVAVPNNGYVVLRFRADNPGFWLFHCHFLFHIVIGMNLVLQVLNPLDAICNRPRTDAICVNQLRNAKKVDRELLQERPDVKIFLPFRFLVYRPDELFRPNTYNRFLAAPGGDHVLSLIDEISHVSPPSPLISQLDDVPPEQFCNGDNRPADCGKNCMCTHMIDIPLNAIVEVVLVDEVQSPNLSHPFHLHGYTFNVIGIGRSPDQNVKKINLKHALDLDRRGLLDRQFNLPPAKDTIAVPNNGYVIFRFRADNPGYWLFHCHFLMHILIGMNLIVHVGTQSDLPPIPPNFPTCGNHLPAITPITSLPIH